VDCPTLIWVLIFIAKPLFLQSWEWKRAHIRGPTRPRTNRRRLQLTTAIVLCPTLTLVLIFIAKPPFREQRGSAVSTSSTV
jgi:hypothetical protein